MPTPQGRAALGPPRPDQRPQRVVAGRAWPPGPVQPRVQEKRRGASSAELAHGCLPANATLRSPAVAPSQAELRPAKIRNNAVPFQRVAPVEALRPVGLGAGV
eukprot:4557785-Lingulodinium_polyedra.AAC.1